MNDFRETPRYIRLMCRGASCRPQFIKVRPDAPIEPNAIHILDHRVGDPLESGWVMSKDGDPICPRCQKEEREC